MALRTVLAAGTIPAGTTLLLTAEQAAARAYALTTVKAATDKVRGTYVADQQVMFKAGEKIGVDGDLDRSTESMLGIAPDEPEAAPTPEPDQKKADK